MLDHLAALFFALAAGSRALCHHLVVLELLAPLGALAAGDRAGFANVDAERPGSRDDAGGGGTDFRTVQARSQRLGVVLLTLNDQLGAVSGTGVAFPRTFIAFFGALGMF